MSGFQITITDAGRAALIDAQNTGTVAFRLSQIGVSTQHVAGGLAALTQLPNERKRLATMAGDVVADDTLHVTIRDETADAYALRAFGLYASTGVLFAVYSQADPILEKSDAAMLLLAIDAKLVALGTAQIEFGPADFSLPPASETVAGVVEIATDAEVDAGLDPWRVITVRTLKRALGALSGFALKVHQHDASDTTSGVFNVGRIPALDMSKITGLAAALAGKAADVHTHAINQILGLTEALAGKAASAHQHVADDIVSGVLAVGRIPALGMEKITGLAVALAGKAGLGEVVRFASVTLGSGRGLLYGDGDRVLVRAGTADLERYFAFNGDGSFHAYNGNLHSQNGRVWDPGNFNPADYARLGDIAKFADVHAVRNATDGVFVFGADGNRWLSHIGDRYEFSTDPVYVQGYRALTTANLASTAEVVAGVEANKAITPAGLWSFARSIGVSGYAQIPGTPLIIQWGRQAGAMSEGQKHVILPVAFGGGCVAMLANPWNSSPTADYYMQISGRFLDRLVFMLNSASGSSGQAKGFDWLAIGFASGTPDPVYDVGSPPGGGGGGGEVF